MSDENLVRLNYASTATFEPNMSGGIEVSVARILAESRRNNNKRQIGGVLHYGNGYFFQCLEGDRERVNDCYQRISRDPRHKDVQLLIFQNVRKRMFPDWSMKYLPIEGRIRSLLASRNMYFDPYRFDDQMVDELVRACVAGTDPTEEPATVGDSRKNGAKAPWWKRILGRG